MEAAKTAIAQLNKDSIIEIKSFINPPKAIVMVMETIMVLLGEKTDWKSIKDNITETNTFIERLKTFNVLTCPESYFTKIRNNYLNKPEFDLADIRKKSVCASYMATWVMAVNRYQAVVKAAVPKQKCFSEVKSVLDQAEFELA